MTPEELIAAATGRLRRLVAQRFAVGFAWKAAAGSLLVVFAARWISWRPIEAIGLVLPAVVVVVWTVRTWARAIPTPTVARVVDDSLSSHDALSAYLQFGKSDSPFADRIVERAQNTARAAEPREAVPSTLVGDRGRVSKRLGAAVLLGGLAIGLAFVDNPQDARRAQEQRERAAVDEARKELEAAAKELGPETAAAQRLAELNRTLAPLSAAEAARELAIAEAELRAEAGQNLDSAIAASEGLNAGTSARPLPGASQGNAAAQLEQAAASLESMSAEEKAELAKRLADLAATQTAGAPDVADALKEAAEAVASADPGAASAVAAAGAAQAAQASAVRSRSSARQAAGAAAAARSTVSGAKPGSGQGQGQGQGQGKGSGSGQGKGSGSGSGQGKGQGSGQGKGSGSGSGSGQGAGGSPSGTISAGTRAGSGSGKGGTGTPGTGTGPSNAPGNEVASGTSDVFAPDPSGGSSGDGPLLGNGGDLGQQVGKGSAPSTRGASRLPLSDAVAKYREQATRAMSDPSVPAAYRDLMSRYFDSLAKGQ